ncbi:MAG: helix-turn-helix transcriptional regulator [Firmicutes bacterium]|nr:helix-turn-helix transcriptional regulator [Bacillota bacterium]
MKEIDYGSVRLKVDEVMSSQGISINKLAFRAEMERTQLKAYIKNDVQRVDLSVLARLCYALDCDLSDIIEYIRP